MSELFAVDVAEDLIAAVGFHVKERLRKGEKEITVLFPNRRAVRFLERALSPPELLNVEIASLEDFAEDTVFRLSDPPPTLQLDIDRYFTLYDILLRHPSLSQRLGGTIERIFPWCIHLSNLFDEFDRHLIATVAPLQYIEEVVEEAREILQNLDTLYKDYRKVMETENLTYRGDLFRRVNTLKEGLSGTFIFVGFALLTRAQKALLTYLFNHRPSAVFFHTDLKKRHPVGDPYRIYADWMDGTFWGTQPQTILGPSPSAPRISFHESFDTHAETQQVSEVMDSLAQETGTPHSPLEIGVILPDSQTLFPTLYALGTAYTPMNVTLGFPFEKSVFHQLLDTLIELVLTRHETRGFYHRPLIKFLSHPFIQSMKIGTAPFQETAKKLQKEIIERGLSFVRFETLEKTTTLSRETLRLGRWLQDEILSPFSEAKTLYEAGNTLLRLVTGFKETISDTPDLHLEREMIRNFLDTVIPNLLMASSAKRNLASPKILCGILKHLVAPLHIPFEGNPLEGIQVMGMLESRLLNFKHLLILDVNEGTLPKSSKIDPLLPPSLNPLVGLPSPKMREALFRYTFFRLIDGAQDVHLFYQKGVSGEEKRVRSRFVEQLLLEEEIRRNEEKKYHSIQELETSLIHTFSFQPPQLPQPDVRKPSFYNALLETCLSGSVSPTLLDEYLDCPYRFYLHRILKMEEEMTLQESQAPSDVGKMIHRLLQTAFAEIVGSPLTINALKHARDTAFRLLPSAIRETLPTLSSLRIHLLEHLAKYRMNTFFAFAEKEMDRYHSIRIIGLEKTFSTELNGFPLTGKVDRIDEMQESPGMPVKWRIIDYKTGRTAKTPQTKLPDFLKSFNFQDYSLNALSKLKRYLRSIQLPMYLYLFRETAIPKGSDSIEAILFLLGSPDGEIASSPLHGDTISQDTIASMILYLINHMRCNEEIAPYDTSVCPTCAYIKICKLTPRAKAEQK